MLRKLLSFVMPYEANELGRASLWSRAATPDELIAAKIRESFAKEFEKWSVTAHYPDRGRNDLSLKIYKPVKKPESYCSATVPFFIEFHFKKDELTVICTVRIQWWSGYSFTHAHSVTYPCVTVNNTLLSSELCYEIFRDYVKLKEARERAEEVAAQAKAVMEENEKKWNLVEQLLGMKRNEFGALVPVSIEQGSCPACPGPCVAECDWNAR